ncbi:MAG TPA: arsenate reductase ArsC [Gemmatimonadales bacterium]|jgi:arsenate reductase|nr:arsenate reductase ArsC [Gemmatimonadales bacterium]
MTTPPAFHVLVLCTGNSARSQIAEALLATRGAGRVIAASAGSHPAPRVNPYAVETLAAHGIAWNDRVPKRLDEVEGIRYDLVITVCDNAAEACPFFPGAVAQVHWGLPDPADETEREGALRSFEETYQALDARIGKLLALPIEEMGAEELVRVAGEIHAG